MKKLLLVWMMCAVCSVVSASPNFLIDSSDEWEGAMTAPATENHVRPMSPAEWVLHYDPWLGPDVEGEKYLYGESVEFVPCYPETGMLYVYEGTEYGDGDAGLVMCWQTGNRPEDDNKNYSSGWEFVYGEDPDLSKSVVRITANPPPPPAGSPPGTGITAISFAFVDINGLRRVWWWSVPAVIPYGVPTPVQIDGSKTGVNATIPPATGYSSALGFNIKQVASFDVDENFKYIFGPVPVPPPGQPQFVGAWNYWHNLLVVPKDTKAYKGYYVKWSQPPFVLEEAVPPLIYGWDETSVYDPQGMFRPIVADDWLCTDDRPITDLHWWGSFKGWTQPDLPPVHSIPRAFHLGIWTDVAANDPQNPWPFSHPGKLIWEHFCDKWVWNLAGYDQDPRCEDPTGQYPCEENEICFQFNQLLSEDEWFYQEPLPDEPNGRVYWLSIAAIYDHPEDVVYPWGWKTRPHFFNDDAVRIDMVLAPDGTPRWPPVIGSTWEAGSEIFLLDRSWDMVFELTTNKEPPCYGLSADLNHDCKVDMLDLAIFAQQWLMTE